MSSPYRLYALSNLGSMLGLLSYPTLVEPNLTIRAQAYGWSGAFLAFSAMCALASEKELSHQQRTSATLPGPSVEEEPPPPPGAEQWFFWIALPASSSVLLLGVTNHLTQNVAAIPFLWVIPLSLYLLSFTLAFWGPALYPRGFYLSLLALAITGMEVMFFSYFFIASLKILLPVFCIGMFVGCMVCHGELARMVPDPRYLTRFYLAIAAGGALGGIFVGVAAPLFFRTTFELPLGIAACATLALVSSVRYPGGNSRGRQLQRALLILASGLSIGVAGFMILTIFQISKGQRLSDRNFYGVLKVSDTGTLEDRYSRRDPLPRLHHPRRSIPATRAGERADHLFPPGFRHRPGDPLPRFLESAPGRHHRPGRGDHRGIRAHRRCISFLRNQPPSLKIAKTEFTYLRDSRANMEVILGDARLSLEREAAQDYDIFIVDAFSGDAIPIHLLTREALQLYLRHLKKDGILALHISNLYIDLKPVIQRLAEKAGMEAVAVNTAGNPEAGAEPAEWVLLAARRETLFRPPIGGAGASLTRMRYIPVWTDDYSSLFRLLK